jgi:hypothetical protein
MQEFITNISSFPTVVFSVMLILVGTFWILAILGAVDIDVFDADLDFDFDMDVDSDVDASGVTGLAGYLLYFGLNGIPITVVISFLTLFSWLFCYFGSAYLLPLLPGSILKFVGGSGLIVGCFFVALPITAKSLKPMKHFFTSPTAVKKASFVGSSCVITTLEVNEKFGQAELSIEGTTVLLNVRAKPSYKLTKGNKAAIVSYEEVNETYEVIPEEEFMKL